MKLADALKRSNELEATCVAPSCGARTRLDARFFASRRGIDIELDDLARSLKCTACGGDRVILGIPEQD